MTSCCLQALVTGKVQGVGYRGATQQQALQANITGYAKNLADGRVEVLLCGERQRVQALREWLWQGPANARVALVECEELVQCNAPERFSTY